MIDQSGTKHNRPSAFDSSSTPGSSGRTFDNSDIDDDGEPARKKAKKTKTKTKSKSKSEFKSESKSESKSKKEAIPVFPGRAQVINDLRGLCKDYLKEKLGGLGVPVSDSMEMMILDGMKGGDTGLGRLYKRIAELAEEVGEGRVKVYVEE